MSDKMTTIKTLENGRAAFAYNCAFKGSEINKPKEYKSYVKKLPVLIKTNGLGQTLAFYESKTNETYQLIYKQLGEWLNKNGNMELKEGVDLVKEIILLDSSNYRSITIEVLSFTKWLSRFADGLIEGEEE